MLLLSIFTAIPLELLLAAMAGVSTAVGSVYALRLAKTQVKEERSRAEIEVMRHKYSEAVQEIDSRHALEKLYIAELESIGAGSAQSVQRAFRDRVEMMGFERPSWSPSRIKEEKKRSEAPSVVQAARMDELLTRRAAGLPAPDTMPWAGENTPIRPMEAPVIEASREIDISASAGPFSIKVKVPVGKGATPGADPDVI